MIDPVIPVMLAGVVLALATTMHFSRAAPPLPSVSAAPCRKRALLGAADRDLFATIERSLPPGHRLLPQVPHDAMLAGAAPMAPHGAAGAHAAMVICDARFLPVAILAHRRRRTRHDAACRAACAQAGLPVVELPDAPDDATARRVVARAIAAGNGASPIDARCRVERWWSRGESNP